MLETSFKNNNKQLCPGLSSLLVVFSLFLTQFFITSHAQAQEAVAVGARIGGDVFRSRLIVDLTKKVKFRTFLLADPYRLIIDVPNLKFRFPDGTGQKGKGVIQAFRYGLFAPGKSRIVIDLNQPADVEKSYSLAPGQGQSGKLVLDLIPIDRETFLHKQQQQRDKRLAELAKKKRRTLSMMKKNDPLADINRFKKAGETPVVVIDPGHGGTDPGARGSLGTQEKDVVLAVGKLVRNELKRRKKYKVHMTRSTDRFIVLQNRVRIARRKHADLFVSVHADSIARKDPTVRGASFYTLSERASDEEARLIALRENQSDILAGVDIDAGEGQEVKNILLDLVRDETKKHSVAFANMLSTSMKRKTIVKQHPIKHANFVVLRAPDVPSVLIELGYLSSTADEKLLRSPEWRKNVAGTIADAIDKYFRNRNRLNH